MSLYIKEPDVKERQLCDVPVKAFALAESDAIGCARDVLVAIGKRIEAGTLDIERASIYKVRGSLLKDKGAKAKASAKCGAVKKKPSSNAASSSAGALGCELGCNDVAVTTTGGDDDRNDDKSGARDDQEADEDSNDEEATFRNRWYASCVN